MVTPDPGFSKWFQIRGESECAVVDFAQWLYNEEVVTISTRLQANKDDRMQRVSFGLNKM